MRLAWVTARAARGTDLDERLALPALRARGADVEVVDWDDEAVDWAGYDRTVLRSAWDYQRRLPEFLGWLERVAVVTDLRNPLPLVRWSLDKRYLLELEEAGVPVVPTALLRPADDVALPDGPCVVKPAVGAGSVDAARYDPGQEALAREHVQRLHARGADVLVQPLVASVARDGEWALLSFAGVHSHAASKRVDLPVAGRVEGLNAPEVLAPHEATAEQRAVADAALAHVHARLGVPTYARVDLVRDETGASRVLEVELAEPSLFLDEGGPAAADRLAAALLDQPTP